MDNLANNVGEPLPSEHMAGLGDLCFLSAPSAPEATRLVTAGANMVISIRTPDFTDADAIVKVESDADQPVTTLASHGQLFAAASEDRVVRLYDSCGNLLGLLPEQQLPVSALAFSPSGTFLAVAGGDADLRVYELHDAPTPETQTQLDTALPSLPSLKTATLWAKLPSPAYTAGLAYDPEGQYLAAATEDGAVHVFDLHTQKQVCAKRRVCPKTNRAAPHLQTARLSWHPDGGQTLMVPGSDGDVTVLERYSWTSLDSITVPNLSGEINLVVPSPNGVYVAVADRKGHVGVVEVATGEEMASIHVDTGHIAGLAWHPRENAVALIDTAGLTRIWKDVVPGASPGGRRMEPHDVSVLLKAAGDGSHEDDGGAPGRKEEKTAGRPRRGMVDQEAEADGDDDDDDNNEDGEEEEGDEDSMLDFIQDDAGVFASEGLKEKKKKHRNKKGIHTTSTAARGGGVRLNAVPPPLQSGQTPWHPELGRRLLAYNLLGFISAQSDPDLGEKVQTVEIHVHDSMSRSRIAPFHDVDGVHCAALGPPGALFASTRGGAEDVVVGANGEPIEPTTATEETESRGRLFFRPFSMWTESASWELSLPAHEKVLGLAVGQTVLAVTTSEQRLRLLTVGGAQFACLDLPGTPIAVAAHGDRVAVTYLESESREGQPPRLAYLLFRAHANPFHADALAAVNVLGATASTTTLPASPPEQGRVALSPRASKVTWFGFAEDGMLAVADDTGMVRVLSSPQSAWGPQWVSVWDADQERKSQGEDFFLVGVAWDTIHAIVTRKGDYPYPLPHPKPVLQSFPAQMPLLGLPRVAPISRAAETKGSSKDQGKEITSKDREAMAAAVASSYHGMEEARLRRALTLTALLTDPSASCLIDEGHAHVTVETAARDMDIRTIKSVNAALRAWDYARAFDLTGHLGDAAMLEGVLRLVGPQSDRNNQAFAHRVQELIYARQEAELARQDAEMALGWGADGAGAGVGGVGVGVGGTGDHHHDQEVVPSPMVGGVGTDENADANEDTTVPLRYEGGANHQDKVAVFPPAKEKKKGGPLTTTLGKRKGTVHDAPRPERRVSSNPFARRR